MDTRSQRVHQVGWGRMPPLGTNNQHGRVLWVKYIPAHYHHTVVRNMKCKFISSVIFAKYFGKPVLIQNLYDKMLMLKSVTPGAIGCFQFYSEVGDSYQSKSEQNKNITKILTTICVSCQLTPHKGEKSTLFLTSLFRECARTPGSGNQPSVMSLRALIPFPG